MKQMGYGILIYSVSAQIDVLRELIGRVIYLKWVT